MPVQRESRMTAAHAAITIEQSILLVRGAKVMLDRDLARLYGVPTKRLNEQVRRNAKRFPADFMFQLTSQEVTRLRSQIATLDIEPSGRGAYSKYFPMAFTEHGVAMLSSVLHSEQAIAVNIAIMRTFAQLRALLVEHKDLARQLNALEQRYDTQFKVVFDAIRQLMTPPPRPTRRRIGFLAGDAD